MTLGGRFNSRTREGCDLTQIGRQTQRRCFNSRTREGCDWICSVTDLRLPCFNSRTREGCDTTCPYISITDDQVSIHAPGRGATWCWCLSLSDSEVFQFTHPGGVRQSGLLTDNRDVSFNSRTREGCDLTQIGRQTQRRCFNSRTREGCDWICSVTDLRLPCFNSRTREGCDTTCPYISITDDQVSIHAPGRGATWCWCLSLSDSEVFQFTHPGGVRLVQSVI